MKKRAEFIKGMIVGIAIVLLVMITCGNDKKTSKNGINDEGVNIFKKVLAKNIILRSAGIGGSSKLIAATIDETVDTETKVLAENVVLDEAKTALESTDVQGAIEEAEPILSQVLVGTWKISQYQSSVDGTGEPKIETQEITFGADGSLSVEKCFTEVIFNIPCGKELIGYKVFQELVVGIIVKDSTGKLGNYPLVFSRLSKNNFLYSNANIFVSGLKISN